MRRVLVVLALALAAGSSFAGDAKQEARAAFDRGNAAHEQHDFATAAREFARADELAPNDDALAAALDEVTLTDDAVFAMRLVQRAEARPGAAASAQKARAKFADKVGYVKVICECTVDGEPPPPARTAVVSIGTHRVGGTRQTPEGPRAWTTEIEVKPGATVEAVAPPPPQAAHPMENVAPAPAPSRPGLSPWWVVVGSVVTAGLGAGTLVSFFDTQSQHDAFVAQQCPVRSGAECDVLASNGRAADLRTGVLFGVTLGAAVGTALVAILGVRWGWKAVLPGAVRVAW